MPEYPRVICTRPWTKIRIVILISTSRTWVAISYGLVLACGHTVVSAVILDTELQLVAQWQTVIANIIILVTVNLVGIFIHNLTEEGQRRAFLDTRDCIAAKLEMEDENEKLVSLRLWRGDIILGSHEPSHTQSLQQSDSILWNYHNFISPTRNFTLIV